MVPGGNSTVGTVVGNGTGGSYLAPASVPSPATVTMTVVSNQNSSIIASSSITISVPPPACSVSIVPQVVTLNTGTNQQFTGTTQNCSPVTVFWQVNGITGGNNTVGLITTGGLYTAPNSVPNPSTVTVTAVSNADNTKTASASVTITTPSTSLNDLGCAVGNI